MNHLSLLPLSSPTRITALIVLLMGCTEPAHLEPMAGSTEVEGPGFGNPCTANGECGFLDSEGVCCTDGCLDPITALCHVPTCTDSASCDSPSACGFHGEWCASCDDDNACTDDVCTTSGCAHFPWTAQTACTTLENTEGSCAIDDFGPNPTGVCCSAGTCLDVVDGNVVCVEACPQGKSCGAYSGACE
jgi:hypothetical protein